jgi:succinoglycan biosynthesis protein ExoM
VNIIGICICTFRRTPLLQELLRACALLHLPEGWTVAVFVVDNDDQKSARPAVLQAAALRGIPFHYDVEPVRNIALSRNRVTGNALAHGCSLLALIDDDELPGPDWLVDLHQGLVAHDCSGVLGPVLPRFDFPPPAWMVRSGFLRRTFESPGTPLPWAKTRTGNVLFRASVLDGEPRPFDPAFGRSGGEDLDFFKRMIGKGHRFVGVNHGAVQEFIPRERARVSHLLNRAYLQGNTNVVLERKYGAGKLNQFRMSGKSLSAVLTYSALLPFLPLLAPSRRTRVGAGLFFHIGRLRRLLSTAANLSRAEFH